MKRMFNERNQIHNFMSSSGSGSDFLTSYGSCSGSGSTSQKVMVPTVPVPVPVPQHCLSEYKRNKRMPRQPSNKKKQLSTMSHHSLQPE
jgi:hypothetical protein